MLPALTIYIRHDFGHVKSRRQKRPSHHAYRFSVLKFRFFFSGCFCDILIRGRIRPERKYYVTKIICFFRKETVLSIAVILALLSMFWVRPDKAYFTYIDFRTLGLLFCLMAIVAGLKAVGVFDILAKNC